MRLSVVMATYNGAPFIERQLESLLTQTRLPDELIISDDGSRDGTLDLARKTLVSAPFAASYLHHTGPRSYSANFVHAAQRSTGDLIFFCDQDDVWRANKLRVMERVFQRDMSVDCVTHDFAVCSPTGTQIASYFGHLRENGVSPLSCVKGCATAVRVGFLETHGWLITGGWTYDKWVCWFSALRKRRAILDEVLMDHSIHGQNASGYISPNVTKVLKFLRRVRRRAFPTVATGDSIARQVLSLSELDALAAHLESRAEWDGEDDGLAELRRFVESRRALLNFRSEAEYQRVLSRVYRSMQHMGRGAYVADEIISSLLNDILGLKASDSLKEL